MGHSLYITFNKTELEDWLNTHVPGDYHVSDDGIEDAFYTLLLKKTTVKDQLKYAGELFVSGLKTAFDE